MGLFRGSLAEGTWVAVNVWNGSRSSSVSVSINGGPAQPGTRTQRGEGEAKNRGVEFADPLALARQATQGRSTWRSTDGGDATAGFTTWKGTEWTGVAGPFQRWMLSDSSHHLWRIDLPAQLPLGSHVMEVKTTDRYGRTFSEIIAFEVVDKLPDPSWQDELWD